MRNIYFYNDESNSIVLEKGNYGSSIFKEKYIQALQQFQRIIKNENETKSNIIAFCGDRGEGKTSCMMSFKYILENQDHNDIKQFLQDNQINPLPVPSKIDVLDMIEPLFFDEKHDLRDLVLGRLYEKVSSSAELQNNVTAKREILKVFFECKHYMKSLLKSREEMYNELEELELLSGGIYLQQKFHQLIQTYLQKINKEYLLIFIDDFDLNMKYAYEMMECIRKYFNSKHCVVVLSCHITQLEKIININMVNEKQRIYDLTTPGIKYINKLLPQSNRIYMPRVSDFCDWPLYIYENRKDNAQDKPTYHSVKEAVVKLIFDKTHYLFYNSKNRVSSIVPDNLRGLRHIISILVNMEDFQSNAMHEENKKRFKTFFFQVWTHQLIDLHLEFVQRLEENQDVMSINKMVVAYLYKQFLQYESLSSDQLWLKNIVNPSNSIYNVSVGDALTLIEYLQKRETDKDTCLFLFFLQSFYSIKLYDYYEVVSEVEGQFRPSTQLEEKGEIYNHEAWFQQCNLLQRFVNGAYFSYNPGDILPRMAPKYNNEPRDKKVISGTELKFLLKGIQEYDQLSPEKKAEFEQKFRLFEYFALTIHRNIAQKMIEDFYQEEKDSKQNRYRTFSEPHHLKAFNPNMGYFVFDVMALFYHILNIQYAYTRFDEITGTPMYDFAKDHNWSLLNQMLDAVQPGEVNYELKEKRLLSDATIRNAEIWMALLELMKQNREYSKDGGSNSKILSLFYYRLSNQKMSTYKVAQDGKPHILSFRFLKPIIKLLQEVDIDTFDSVFDYNWNKNIVPEPVKPLPHIQELFGEYLATYNPVQGKTITGHWKNKYPELNDNILPEVKTDLNRIKKPLSIGELIQFLNEHVMAPAPVHEEQQEQQQEVPQDADALLDAILQE